MRTFIRILIPAVVVFTVWLAWPYLESDKAQVMRQHKRLLALASDRKWDVAKESIAEDYADQWGLTRQESVETARDLLASFFMVEIEWTPQEEVSVNDNIAKVRGFAKITGSGGGPSEYIKTEVNTLKQPWVFTWRRDSRGPHGWKLVSVRNAGLDGVAPKDALEK
jgi:hypothetical protein